MFLVNKFYSSSSQTRQPLLLSSLSFPFLWFYKYINNKTINFVYNRPQFYILTTARFCDCTWPEIEGTCGGRTVGRSSINDLAVIYYWDGSKKRVSTRRVGIQLVLVYCLKAKKKKKEKCALLESGILQIRRSSAWKRKKVINYEKSRNFMQFLNSQSLKLV